MFSSPEQIIEQLNLKHGSRVADLGAGSGFYSLAAARAIGDKGKVYAIDIQKDLSERLKKEANRQGFFNIETLWGNVEKMGGTHLKDELVDLVIAANLLFQLEDKHDFPLEVKRILKPNGKVLVVDWLDSFRGMGPAPHYVFTAAKARELFERVGFTFDRQIRAGERHWGMLFRKAEKM